MNDDRLERELRNSLEDEEAVTIHHHNKNDIFTIDQHRARKD